MFKETMSVSKKLIFHIIFHSYCPFLSRETSVFEATALEFTELLLMDFGGLISEFGGPSDALGWPWDAMGWV